MKITLGAVTGPLDSLKIHTGDWGTEYPVVDEEKCRGCGECELYCPDLCIKIIKKNEKKVATVDYNYCKGCGICSTVCPFEAIKMELKDIFRT